MFFTASQDGKDDSEGEELQQTQLAGLSGFPEGKLKIIWGMVDLEVERSGSKVGSQN